MILYGFITKQDKTLETQQGQPTSKMPMKQDISEMFKR